MGDQEEYGPHDPRRYEDSPREVLEGEIILPDRTRGHGRSQHNRKGNEYGRIMDEDLIREVVEARRIKKWTLQKCADTFGVSKGTVGNWAGERGNPIETPNVLKIRGEIAESLALVSKEAWKIHDETTDRKVKLDALARIESVDRTRAVLHGANAPVRHDVTLTAVTEAERELQEILREAAAAEAVREAAVIKAASEDADL